MNSTEITGSPRNTIRLMNAKIAVGRAVLNIRGDGRIIVAGNRVVGVAPADGILLISKPHPVSTVFGTELVSQFIKLLSEWGIACHIVPLRMKTQWFGSEINLDLAFWNKCVTQWVRSFLGGIPMPLPDLLPSHQVWCVARLIVWRRQWQAVRLILQSMQKSAFLEVIAESLRCATRRWEIEMARTVSCAERDQVSDEWVRSEIATSDRYVVSTITHFLPDFEFGPLTVARLL